MTVFRERRAFAFDRIQHNTRRDALFGFRVLNRLINRGYVIAVNFLRIQTESLNFFSNIAVIQNIRRGSVQLITVIIQKINNIIQFMRTGEMKRFPDFALVGFTFPRFITCIAFIYFFSFRLRLAPAMGMHSVGDNSLTDLIGHLILPASIIGFGAMGYLIKQTRSACLEVFQEDYLKTARAKGISEARVVVCHGLRTALAPILTQATLSIPEIVGNSAITEKIFGWPGIGALMIDAIRNRDTPLIMGVALVIAVIVLSANILLDIAYGLLDPRVTSR